MVVGAGTMWVFRRSSDREVLRSTVRHIQAYLLEFWLFVDEPRLIGKTWKGLLLANLRLYRVLLVPLLILPVILTPVFFGLDAFYGSTPLVVGKPALVTIAMGGAGDQLSSIPQLNAPGGISIDSPPVRVFSEREVSWRVRPLRPLAGEFHFVLDGKNLAKSVTAGEGLRFHSAIRTRSLVEWIRYPMESPLPAGPVDWIQIDYPPASVQWFGLEAHWSIWFLVFSGLGAVLSPRQ
jgi:hypothetical protein